MAAIELQSTQLCKKTVGFKMYNTFGELARCFSFTYSESTWEFLPVYKVLPQPLYTPRIGWTSSKLTQILG